MNDLPIFDETIFSALTAELGCRDVAEVLSAFLRDTRTKVRLCVANVNDPALVKREAHSIKSSAGTFGFLKLSAIARDLDKGAPTLPHIQALVSALEVAFDDVSRLAQALLRIISGEIVQ